MFENRFSKDCLLFESFKRKISSLIITKWNENIALWKTIQIDLIFSLSKKNTQKKPSIIKSILNMPATLHDKSRQKNYYLEMQTTYLTEL